MNSLHCERLLRLRHLVERFQLDSNKTKTACLGAMAPMPSFSKLRKAAENRRKNLLATGRQAGGFSENLDGTSLHTGLFVWPF